MPKFENPTQARTPVAMIDRYGDLVIFGNDRGAYAVYVTQSENGDLPEVDSSETFPEEYLKSAKQVFYKGDKVTIEF